MDEDVGQEGEITYSIKMGNTRVRNINSTRNLYKTFNTIFEFFLSPMYKD